jgi:hypothetical protein
MKVRVKDINIIIMEEEVKGDSHSSEGEDEQQEEQQNEVIQVLRY